MTDGNETTGGAGTATATATEQAQPTAEELRKAELERALAEAQALAEERGTALAALTERVKLATAKYRQAALAAMPEVPEDLVQGESVEEVDAALARVRTLVDEMRRRTAAAPRTPAGAPARSAPDVSAMSAREKIAHGLAKRG